MRYPIRFAASLLPRLFVLFVAIVLSTALTLAQQTLGGITGSVSDVSGAVIPNATVTAVNEQTTLTRTVKTNAEGEYNFVNLPIGTYTLTFTADSFDIQKSAHINVQADRTLSLNAQLKIAAGKGETIEVDATPLMNAVDTTVGYIMDTQQIDAIPLPTGSFTGAAILSPGVNAELPGGTGANSGLGNAPIWANGQRDTSNSFSLNGVDISNLFNGKSTSQVPSARVINSTGVSSSEGAGGVIPSVASVYLAIGNALPTPDPDSLQELRVNASMYDAQQGSTSGAHIDMSTKSGSNQIHGGVTYRRATDWLNAAPFFFNQDPDIPDNAKVPQLHRWQLGGTIGAPIIKDKLFGYISYQHLHVSDQELGDTAIQVPVGLSDDRSAGTLANVVNNGFGTTLNSSNIDPVAYALFNAPAAPGEPGKWLIPNDQYGWPTATHTTNAFIPGTAYMKNDQVVGNLDYNASSKDTVAAKYFYQHDPFISPYSYSSVPGFTQHLDAGAQVFSVVNTLTLKSNLSTTQTLGFLREKIYGTNDQIFGSNNIPGGASINNYGYSNYFPGVSVYNDLGTNPSGAYTPTGILNIGPNAEGQAPHTGMFQNRIAPSGNAIWVLGKHTLAFGANYTYTQLNTIDRRTGTGTIATDDLSQMIQGLVTPGSSATGFYVSSFLQGDANRYYRANQLGMYLQDKFQITPTLSLTAGLRYDWDGGLTEKYGRLFNFDGGTNPDSCTQSSTDPNAYAYCVSSDTLVNPGLIIAGNNANGSKGVSNTTLTGRQWGMAPRVGAAWQPSIFNNKIVVRTGTGFYYDRGELFSYFSPGYAIGTVTGGPFGVNQQLPFVNASSCPVATQYLYEGYIPTCGGTNDEGNIENPYGGALKTPPTNPKASDLANYLPNASTIANDYGQPISLGVYGRGNKLPYSINYTLDIQWQPRSDLAVELGYVGNVGRHQVIPVPFNQPNIASPGSPTLGGGPFQQNYSYGYTVTDPNTEAPLNLDNGTPYLSNYEGGNVDLRVPYTGYAAESIKYVAAGVNAYNALQAHIEKRLSKGIQVGASYTYSHATDEQSGLGLFYNGNNALDLRSGYGLADFDRTHVINFNYVFQVPDTAPKNSLLGKLVNGWNLQGLTVLQSGQPYSIIDFSGAIGSIYYSTADGITNPIVPLANGCTAKSALTGASGAWANVSENNLPALKPSCFTLPTLAAGGLGGAIPSTDPYETGFTSGQRNIFRQSFQKRADASLVKLFAIHEKYNFKYTFDVFNLTNTTSLDVPGNEVSQNQYYDAFPVSGTPVLPGTCNNQGTGTVPGSFYNCPGTLGVVTHTIGAPRQIQMSLSLKF